MMAGGAALSGMAGGDGQKSAQAAGDGGGHLCSAGCGRAVGGYGRAPADGGGRLSSSSGRTKISQPALTPAAELNGDTGR
jgi:hypothetical protein|uniref:Uncharacterized protein n=1 Tax=Oryza sativa subsp. japonica TaxID=39947 RepID=Q6K312_ORYSJ|nr:hypothetical protein [Oryza sativa Japonica Group]